MFLTQTLKKFKTTGAIAPVRKRTAEKMVNPHIYELCASVCVVEFGAGTGVISDEILKFLLPDARLILVESNPDFAKLLQDKYAHDTRVYVECRFAQDSDNSELIDIIDSDNVDAVFNSIPMSLINKQTRTEIYDEANRLLIDDGLFVQYQYTPLHTYKLMKNVFKRKVELRFTWTNIIPTFFMTVKK